MDLKEENNETKNNDGEKNSDGNVSADNIAFLELLLTDKKEKEREYEKAKKYIQELIASESNEPEKFKLFIRLVLKGEVPIVKGFFEQEWESLSPENKDLAIDELLAISADKGMTRQATVAQIIAAKNNETAAKIIYHILVGNKQKIPDFDFSLITKDKKDTLRSRFFPQNGTWISINSSDKQILQTLILFFSELASEIEEFGKSPYMGIALNFSRWVITSLKKVDMRSELVNRIDERLSKIINRLPPNAQQELRLLRDNPDQKLTETKINIPVPVKNSPLNETFQKRFTDTSEKTSVQNEVYSKRDELKSIDSKKPESKLLPIIQKKDSQKISDLSTPEQLLKEKQNTVSQLSSEIEILSKLIAERDLLLVKQKELRNRLDPADDETERLETKFKDLRRNFDEIENAHSKAISERDKANSFQKQLREELSETKKQLEQATISLESERSEYIQRSKQKVEFEIENFKGNLTQKLGSIFDNKRQTDLQPNNERLAEFLRGWFSEIERVLNKFGINP